MPGASVGRLRHRVALRTRSGADSPWRNEARLWAQVESQDGDLELHAGAVAARERVRVTLRYRKGVLPGLRLRIDGSDFDILAVLDRRGTRRWLHCICERLGP